jgi:diadenosine tetraphosphate (Ap4A) HIT family hydrolase
MKECPFCKIWESNSSHSFKVLVVGEHCVSVLDQYPVSEGHCLVIPKRHVATIWELTDEELKDLYTVMKQTDDWIFEWYHPDGTNYGINEGSAAGQTIPHLHIHLIPRYNGDVPNPEGGVRGVIPWKQEYTPLFLGEESKEYDPYGILRCTEFG